MHVFSRPIHSLFRRSGQYGGMQTLLSTKPGFAPHSRGRMLDASPSSFGELVPSNDILGDAGALAARLETDGYLFLRGLLNRDDVLEARRHAVGILAADGCLAPGTDPMEAVAREGVEMAFRPDLAVGNAALSRCLYTGALMDFYRTLFGEEVLHFDFTWFRAVAPGLGTKPHCDVVYMGRGERQRLLTAWVPTGDIPVEVGGLTILEGSHRQHERLRHYLERDVDTYCTNGRHAAEIESGRKAWEWDGSLSADPVSLREKLGGRWLTTSFRAGDVLTFSMHTVHASLDNPSRHIRLSSDSRYQPASRPADERWIGEKPIGHSLAGKRGRIC
jgi:hypothetical protein